MYDSLADTIFEYLENGDGYDYETMTTEIMMLSDDSKQIAAAILEKFIDVVNDANIRSRLKITVNELRNESYSFT